MVLVRIIVLRRDRSRIVAMLQRMGIIDFRKSRLGLQDDENADYYEVIPRMLSTVSSALAVLPKGPVARMGHMEPRELIKAVGREMDIIGRVQELGYEKAELEERIVKARTEGSPHESELRERLETVDRRLERISVSRYSRLACLKEMLEIEDARADAVLMFKRTRDTCVIEGWIPARREHELRRSLQESVSGRYTMEHVRTKEMQPTYYHLPGILMSFDRIVGMYSTPRSDEINPAWFMLLTFPVLYGLMISDVGYGILSLAIAAVIAKVTDKDGLLHSMANIWMLSSIFTVIFGVFNDQYFGFALDRYIFPSFLPFDWSHNVHIVIIAALLIGIFQICVGLALGMLNNVRMRRPRVVLAKLFMLSALISGAVAVSGILFHAVSPDIAVGGLAVSLASIALIIAFRPAQWGRLIDMIVYPISYVRIMGFGFTSVLIASIINDAFAPDISSGIGEFLLYLVVFVILHLANMALSTFEGAVQSMRLNFIEFFEEFYTGRGIKYAPFSYRRRHTFE
ncbi:MAG: hypothetical protein KGH69_04945 [Candidatus Micrarchaeota archaeon]|nr:hypothetical protein [Candidatus Micrarchaeota archaeon]